MRILLAILAVLSLSTPASAQLINVDIDISKAQRLLEIACSGAEIVDSEFTASPVVQSQIDHHQEFGARFSMENYLSGLRAMAECKTPESDIFRFKSLVEKRALMEKAINHLALNRDDLIKRVHDNLVPYVPADMEFEGKAIIAAASFSCGGFSNRGMFFIDLPCLAPDIEGEYEAIAQLITHETYHAIQSQFASRPMVSKEDVSTDIQAWDYMFHRLAIEGSASFVGDMRNIKGDGRYAKYSRDVAQRSFRHLSYNFRLLGILMEAIGNDPASVKARFPEIYGLAFDGSFGELSYFTGHQMTAEIVHSFAARSLPCLLAQPPENFALAYHEALADGDNLEKSENLPASIVEIAGRLSKERTTATDIDVCLGEAI
ncbi:DUF5700 domain-containing putative Zn-dependent protease [Parasphingorhabdus sp.]|uniref:DUF5700 domain-containing putative Zn-dependent protease n=1 Tax=Parasphingorhabdus sp. TaxID=2709688 RepID=UPI003A8EEF5A